jgi:type II secretory ATPase GspE/PulE/Tfp pilus assembly ATPase PilB-like protein
MVGEIRDRETAKIVIQASISGHLVFTTIHTNDSVGAIIRLLNMEIEPFLIASGLSGVVAQRLVRKICLNCQESYKPSSKLLEKLGLSK